VVKWRKGNPYLYRQTTYRDAGVVRTKNTYIGRAGSEYAGYKEGEIIVTKDTNPKEIGLNTNKRANEIISRVEINKKIIQERKNIQTVLSGRKKNSEQQTEVKEKKEAEDEQISKSVEDKGVEKVATTKKRREKTKELEFSKFESDVDLPKYQVNRLTLEREQKRIVKSLHGLGLDVLRLSKIKLVKGGKSPEFKKSRYVNVDFECEVNHPLKFETTYEKTEYFQYEINMPRFVSGNRTKFKTAYKKALASAALDLLEEQDKDKFSNIRYFFDTSYQQTQNMLNFYILNTNDRDRIFKSLLVKGFFGLFGGQIPNNIQGKTTKTKEIGLIDNTTRKNWKDDAINVLAEIIGKGHKNFIKERQVEYQKSYIEQINSKIDWHKSLGGFCPKTHNVSTLSFLHHPSFLYKILATFHENVSVSPKNILAWI